MKTALTNPGSVPPASLSYLWYCLPQEKQPLLISFKSAESRSLTGCFLFTRENYLEITCLEFLYLKPPRQIISPASRASTETSETHLLYIHFVSEITTS
jgi:hypothetical protein